MFSKLIKNIKYFIADLFQPDLDKDIKYEPMTAEEFLSWRIYYLEEHIESFCKSSESNVIIEQSDSKFERLRYLKDRIEEIYKFGYLDESAEDDFNQEIGHIKYFIEILNYCLINVKNLPEPTSCFGDDGSYRISFIRNNKTLWIEIYWDGEFCWGFYDHKNKSLTYYSIDAAPYYKYNDVENYNLLLEKLKLL